MLLLRVLRRKVPVFLIQDVLKSKILILNHQVQICKYYMYSEKEQNWGSSTQGHNSGQTVKQQAVITLCIHHTHKTMTDTSYLYHVSTLYTHKF